MGEARRKFEPGRAAPGGEVNARRVAAGASQPPGAVGRRGVGHAARRSLTRTAHSWPVWRVVAVAIISTILFAASASLAQALWADHDEVTPPPVRRGAVSFSAEEQVDPTPEYSQSGGGVMGTPVHVTLPGKVLVGVLEGGTVVWRFTVTGYAMGSAGLTYDVSYVEVDDGTDAIDTVREGTQMKVYRADAAGDCSDPVEDLSATVGDVVTIADQVLQSPNSNPSQDQITQLWCVAMMWDADPPGDHTNVALASGTGSDGRTVSGSDAFSVTVKFPPSLDSNGEHINEVDVRATGVNGRIVTAAREWKAALSPDPDNEADATITVTPQVTTAS
ncbi:MAG: hypothetical protein LBV06_11035 [Propionibacteriaceae bacterium]|nr:hypothetical protein [Propionibacteriaceae bacterium]